MTEQTIRRAKHDADNPYFIMSRATAQDTSLSWEARGVLAYLLSKPDNWETRVPDLQQQCGRDKVRGILKELEDAGYLTVERLQHADGGKFTANNYFVHETPVTPQPSTPEPSTENPSTAEPSTANPPLTYKREDKVQKEQSTDDEDDNARAREGLQASKPEPEAPNIFSLYHTTFGKLVSNPLLADDLKDLQAEFAWPDIVDAFKVAALANAANHNYARRCLENWRLNGRDKPPTDRPATPKGTGPLPRPSKPNARVSPLPPLAENVPPPSWLNSAKAGAS